MKNVLLKAAFILCSASIFVSCSQSEKITANKGPQYTYRKVYEGNRILYRDLEKNDNQEKEKVVAENKPVVKNKKDSHVQDAPEQKKKESDVKDMKEEQHLVHTFANNFRQIHESLSSGNFLSKIRHNKHLESTQSSEDDHTSAISTGDIFAILGFAFGLAGFLGSGIGIAASILGLVFSILGLNSNLRILAIIGLVVSAISLAFAIFA